MPRSITDAQFQRARELTDQGLCDSGQQCDTCRQHAIDLLEEAGELEDIPAPDNPCGVDNCRAASYRNDPNGVHRICSEAHDAYVCGDQGCNACLGHDPSRGIEHDESSTRCRHCDEWKAAARFETTGRVSACEDCWDSGELCAVCGTLRDAATIEGLRVDGDLQETCELCVNNRLSICDACGDYSRYPEQDRETGDTLCNACFRVNHSQCSTCRTWVHANEDHFCGSIERYDFMPQLQFVGDHPDQLYIGMELEVENNGHQGDTYLAGVFEQFVDRDRAWLTRDGSLHNGFEIVTHPMTPDAWYAGEFDWNVLDELRMHGMEGTARCGIHLHVNKEAFYSGPRYGYIRASGGGIPVPRESHASPHLFKFLQFLYRNPDECQVIGERGSVNYAAWRVVNERRESIKYAKDKRHCNGDRYLAVNLRPENTIELRFFQGTINTERVIKNIEFVDALFDYTKELGVKDAMNGGLNWLAFAQWVEGLDQHPSLLNFMSSRGLLP